METIKGMHSQTRQLWRHKSGEVYGIEINNLQAGQVVSCVGPLPQDEIPSTIDELNNLEWTDGIIDAIWADQEDNVGNFQLLVS